MDTWGYVILVAAAVVLGLIAQYLLRGQMGYDWLATAIGAGIGGFVASEYSLGGLGQWGTEIQGLAIFPALIGAILVGAIVELVLWFAMRPSMAR